MADTLLVLPADMGGTAFGPFGPGHVAMGSDPAQCHIALAPTLGLAPVHAWITLTADGQRWVQPAQQGAAVYLQRSGRGTAAPVLQALALQPGDVVALGHPQGVRFEVQEHVAAPPPAAGRTSPRLGGRQAPTAQQLGQEVQRQAMSRAMTHGGVSQAAQVLHRARSGALLQPRYIIGALIALLGVAATGCAGLWTALRQAI